MCFWKWRVGMSISTQLVMMTVMVMVVVMVMILMMVVTMMILLVVMHLITAICIICGRSRLVHGGLHRRIPDIPSHHVLLRLRRVMVVTHIHHMKFVDVHIPTDVQLVDRLVGDSVVEVAEFVAVHFDQKVFIMIDNANVETIAKRNTIMMSLLLLPSPAVECIHHHSVLKRLEAEIHMQCDVLTTPARSILNSKSMMVVVMVAMRLVCGAINVQLRLVMQATVAQWEDKRHWRILNGLHFFAPSNF